jgi:signal transduction histidine kinase
MLSHELRTPLTLILLWANATLEEEQTAPSPKDGIQMVRGNVELEASLFPDLSVPVVQRIKRGFPKTTLVFYHTSSAVLPTTQTTFC